MDRAESPSVVFDEAVDVAREGLQEEEWHDSGQTVRDSFPCRLSQY